MTTAALQPRYSLTITYYPSDTQIIPVAKLIYSSSEASLVSALHALPYVVGRSFSREECLELADQLKELNVGYAFKGNSQNLPKIEFHPNKQNDPDLKLIKNKSKSLSWFRIALTIGVPLLMGLTINFYLHNKKSGDDGDLVLAQKSSLSKKDSRAKILSILNDVQIKTPDRFLWTKANLQEGLFVEDRVKTGSNSYSQILYIEGHKLELKPDTLLTIGKDLPQQKEIYLEEGDFKAELVPQEQSTTLTIHAQDTTIELEAAPRSQQKSPTKMRAQLKNGSVMATLSEGKAKVLNKKATAPIVILKNQQLVVKQDENPLITTRNPLLLETVFPTMDHRWLISPEHADDLSFEWNAIPGAEDYHVEISTDPDLKQIFLSEVVKGTKLKLKYLDLGTLYWRVTTEANDELYQSKVLKFYVQDHRE